MEIKASDILTMDQVENIPPGKFNPYTRQLLSLKKKGVLNPKFKGRYITPAGKFDSAAQAAEANGTSRKTAYNRCHSKYKTSAGWAFEPTGTNMEDCPAYQLYLSNKRNGILDNGKKAAHFAIYKPVQEVFKRKGPRGLIAKANVSMSVIGRTPLKSYPAVTPQGNVTLNLSQPGKNGAQGVTKMPGAHGTDTSVYRERGVFVTGTEDRVTGDLKRGVTGNEPAPWNKELRDTVDNDPAVRLKNEGVSVQKSSEVGTEGVIHPLLTESHPSEKITPGSHPAHPLQLFSRPRYSRALNSEYKPDKPTCLYNSNEAAIRFKSVHLIKR